MPMTTGSRFSGEDILSASKRLRPFANRMSALEHPDRSIAASAHVSKWHSTDWANCWPSAAHRARFLGLSGHQKIIVGRELGAAAAVVLRSLRGRFAG